jgi:cytochrome c-type biogenesis protein CcmH/NrfG
VILSALVVCSILIAAVATVSNTNLFGNSDKSTDTNYKDPNADVIGAQETAVAKDPNDFSSVALLANLLSNTGSLTQAIPYYEKALAIRPDDEGTRLDFARALADGNLRPDAEVQFQLLLKQDPNNQQAHYYLAELYRNWAPPRTAEAITEYRKAIAADTSTYIAQQSQDELDALGAGTPAASPQAGSTPTTTEATP